MQEIANTLDPASKIIIFVETKKKVEGITRNIRGFGWRAVCMHGDKSQDQRDYVLKEFRNGKASILVATDVAARGLGKLFCPGGKVLNIMSFEIVNSDFKVH